MVMMERAIPLGAGTSEVLRTVRDSRRRVTLSRPETRNPLSDHVTPAPAPDDQGAGERCRNVRCPHEQWHSSLTANITVTATTPIGVFSNETIHYPLQRNEAAKQGK
jgi:hypothetical protein